MTALQLIILLTLPLFSLCKLFPLPSALDKMANVLLSIILFHSAYMIVSIRSLADKLIGFNSRQEAIKFLVKNDALASFINSDLLFYIYLLILLVLFLFFTTRIYISLKTR